MECSVYKWSATDYMRVIHLHPQLIYRAAYWCIDIRSATNVHGDSHFHFGLVGYSTCIDHAHFAYPALHICICSATYIRPFTYIQ